MIRPKLAAVIAILGTLILFSVQLLLPHFFLGSLNTSLPFRQAYSPTLSGILFTYVIPLLVGYMSSIVVCNSQTSSGLYYINLSLIAGLINAVPFLIYTHLSSLYWFDGNAVTYFLLLYPIIFSIGSICAVFPKIEAPSVFEQSAQGTADYLLAIIFGLIALVLNLLPLALSSHLVGADVYYHSAMTQIYSDTGSISQSPFFAEGKNYYISIIYPLLSLAHRVSHLSFNVLWQLYIPVCSFFFISIFYLFARSFTRTWVGASIAVSFAFTSTQILWADPSVRAPAYCALIIFLFAAHKFLYTRQKIWIIVGAIFFLYTLASHPEIGLHAIGIVLAFVCLRFLRRYQWLPVSTRFVDSNLSGYNLPQLSDPRTFGVLLVLMSLLLSAQIYKLLQLNDVGQILIFNEYRSALSTVWESAHLLCS